MTDRHLHQSHVETEGRQLGENVLPLLRLIHEDIRALHDRQESQDRMLAEHIRTEEDTIRGIMAAFPDGPENHREAHQAMIDAANEQRTFWRELRLEVAKKGVWALLIIVLGLLAAGAGVKFGLPTK